MVQTTRSCWDCFWHEEGDKCHVHGGTPLSAQEQRNPGWLRSIVDSASFCGKEGKRFRPSIDAVIRSNSSATRAFLFAGANPAPPKQFGLAVAKMAIDTTRSDVADMIGTQESAIQQGIASRALLAHIHLLVLQAAVYYVYAGKLLALPKDVLAEFYDGIMEGFATFLVTADGKSVGGSMPDLFRKLFVLYGNSLFNEVGEELGNDLIGMGATASLVTNAIAHQCDIDVLLNGNAMERLRLEMISARCGIRLLLMLCKENSITFVA